MRIFVTGASGYLGRQLVGRLVRAGHTVSGLARSSASAESVAGLGATAVRGSLDSIAEWADALTGHDAVVHCAALITTWDSWDTVYRENTLATKELAEHAAERGARRFVFISSEAALQGLDPLDGIDETLPYPDEPNSYYGKSKKLAEQALLNMQTEMQIVILRPASIWGPGCKTIEEVEQKIRSGSFMWIDHGRVTIETSHVQNVVEAIMRALEHGGNKQIYFVTDDDPITVKDYFVPLLEAHSVKMPEKSISNGVAKTLARLVEAVWRTLKLRGAPPLNVFEWSFVGQPRRYIISKIKQELGYSPVVTRAAGIEEYRAAVSRT